MKRNKFSLSHYRLASMEMGRIVPLSLMEVLPGDTIQQATSCLIRTMPLLAPVMHPVSVKIHHWFVPHRLIWEDFEDFITGGPDGLNASVFPTIQLTGSAAWGLNGAAVGSLGDHLGVQPMPGATNIVVSALPFRGYGLIYNEWYRDADLMTPVTIDITSGADTTTNTTLLNAAWEKDYFTSARPWDQKGPALGVGLVGQPPVIRNSTTPGAAWDGHNATTGAQLSTQAGIRVSAGGVVQSEEGGTPGINFDPNGSLLVDLQAGAGFTIQELREQLALMRYQEARARYGSRYTEYLRYLSVRSSDARLQRPEYLGGGRQTVQFSEVLQTATGGTEGVGTLRGHGISAMRTNRYRRFFEEHGYVFTLMITRPKTIYTQGLKRHWNRRTKEDFWQRELEHIGQQAIKNKEVYAAAASPDGTFGFQDRYDEYRRQESGVAGEFRTILNFWHYSRDFASEPALNSTFVTSVPTKRTYPVATNDVMYVMANHSIQARRLLSRNATPRTF